MIYPPTKAEGDILERRRNCMFRNTYTATERLKFFPFNTYKKVVLISFERPTLKSEIFIDSTGKRKMIRPKQEFDFSTKLGIQAYYKSITKEEKVLSSQGINELTNILYNLGLKSTKSYNGITISETTYACYNPRNAILFLDKNGDLAEYIEFCFECHGRRISSKKFKLGDFCNQKYDIIKKFFKSAGINYVEQNENSQ